MNVPPSQLTNMTSPWPFSAWGIDIIGKITPKASNGHEFILVAIDYFTKWVEAASFSVLKSSHIVAFMRENIICRYGVPHELISDHGSHFKGEVLDLLQEYSITSLHLIGPKPMELLKPPIRMSRISYARWLEIARIGLLGYHLHCGDTAPQFELLPEPRHIL